MSFWIFSKVCRFDEAIYLAPPGAVSSLIRMRKESLGDDKGLYLAGEYTSIGGIEIGVHSGFEAVAAVLQQGFELGALKREKALIAGS